MDCHWMIKPQTLVYGSLWKPYMFVLWKQSKLYEIVTSTSQFLRYIHIPNFYSFPKVYACVLLLHSCQFLRPVSQHFGHHHVHLVDVCRVCNSDSQCKYTWYSRKLCQSYALHRFVWIWIFFHCCIINDCLDVCFVIKTCICNTFLMWSSARARILKTRYPDFDCQWHTHKTWTAAWAPFIDCQRVRAVCSAMFMSVHTL